MVASSPFPGRPFSLQVDAELVSQDIPGNRSRFYGWCRIHKDSYSPTYSNNPTSSWEVTARQARVAAASGLTYDFRNGTDFYLWQGYFYLSHNADGSFPASNWSGYATYDLLGHTSVSLALSAPRIARGPRVRVNGTWRNSVAYVRVGGVWRIATPYVRVNGTWRIGGG